MWRLGLRLGGTPGWESVAPHWPSVIAVSWELVRKVHRKAPLVVHSNMERDVALLRLYPGIPTSLVGILATGLPCPSPGQVPAHFCLSSGPTSKAFAGRPSVDLSHWGRKYPS